MFPGYDDLEPSDFEDEGVCDDMGYGRAEEDYDTLLMLEEIRIMGGWA